MLCFLPEVISQAIVRSGIVIAQCHSTMYTRAIKSSATSLDIFTIFMLISAERGRTSARDSARGMSSDCDATSYCLAAD